MQGKLYKNPSGEWMIRYSKCVPGKITKEWGSELPLHPKDAAELNEWDQVFDNLEARIAAKPEIEFEIVGEYARMIKEESENDEISKEELAILFHDTYEELAPSFGYQTREDTKKFDPSTPNGKLMIAVCERILETLNKNK